jgi:DNA-binding response OmpR family regulator
MNTQKKKILVVDDDENLRTVLVDKLEISGFDALGAKDGQEGLDKALTNHPDMVILDGMMPRLTGWQVLEKLRQDTWGKDVKVIMLTAVEDFEKMAKAMEGGSCQYLVKTNYSLDEVVKKIQDMFAGKK